MVVHVLTTLLYLSVAACLHVARGTLEIYEAGKCKQGIDDVIATDVSFASCTDVCKARDWCTGVSYMPQTIMCRVHGSNAIEKSITECTKWVYSERNVWHEQDFPSESPRCDQSRATADQLTCQYQDCPEPSMTEGALQLFGNLRTVGAKIAFRCDTDHVLVGKSSLTCLPGGHWNGNVPSCGFEDIVDGYKLVVVIGQLKDYDQAESTCAQHSASLVRIDTPAKQEAIRAHIVTLSGGNPFRYWIQCRKDTSDGVYKFDDGTPVPMTNDYWGPDEPRGTGACGYMFLGHGFDWANSKLCSYPMGYICEIQ